MRKTTKLAAAVGASALVIGSAGIAYAYWSSTGTGTHTSTAASANGTVLYTVSFNAATLAPGTTVPITYTATTSDATDLQVVDPTAVVTSSVPACEAWLSVSQPTQGSTTIIHGVSNTMGGGFVTFANSASNQNTCQGQAITVTVTN
jgi:hypothetical protein